jgi:hypothetical protein
MTIDWIALFAAFGVGSLFAHFLQQYQERRRMHRASSPIETHSRRDRK